MFFPVYLATVPRIKARSVLHFAVVYQGTTLCSVFFCPPEPTGVTQEGVNTDSFLLRISFMPPPLRWFKLDMVDSTLPVFPESAEGPRGCVIVGSLLLL